MQSMPGLSFVAFFEVLCYDLGDFVRFCPIGSFIFMTTAGKELSPMETKAKYTLIPQDINEYIYRQAAANYQKNDEKNYDLIDYVPSNTIRVWVNNDTVTYVPHLHQTIEIIYPLENEYYAYTGTDKHVLQPGDIFIIPSGMPHQLQPPAEYGLRLIFMVDLNILAQMHNFNYMTAYLSAPSLINSDTCGPLYDELAPLLLKICRNFFDTDVFREMAVYSDLLIFLSKYVRAKMAEEDNSLIAETSMHRQTSLMARLNIVFNYLDEHFSEDITLEKVADIAGFSKYHFSRLFKQCSGYNFYDYLCYRRIKNAETMLLNPETSITEIALYSGFSSLSTFNRTFKKLKNCTPTEYRALYNNDDRLSELHQMKSHTGKS